MKTIYTTLPIYNKIAKQAYERSKHAGWDQPVPIVCPRHRLPSFQWKDDGDGASFVSSIELINSQYTGLWETLVTNWASNSYFDSFVNVGLEITTAINNTGVCFATSSAFNSIIGEKIRIRGTLAINSGAAPVLFTASTTPVSLLAGYNDITIECKLNGSNAVLIYSSVATNFTFTGVTITKVSNSLGLSHFFTLPVKTGDYFSYNGETFNYILPTGKYYLKITTDNALVYYSEWFLIDCVFGIDETLPPIEDYSEKYLIINFSNTCNLGDISYEDGFEQTLWFISEPMESTFPQEEEGAKNGDGQYVRTFARQVKKYLVRTGTMPDYMVDVFNRMKLHDTVTLTDLVGDTNNVYNLEVEHEWMNTDKYHAKIELTFDYDEAVVVTANCETRTIAEGVTADSGIITADNM